MNTARKTYSLMLAALYTVFVVLSAMPVEARGECRCAENATKKECCCKPKAEPPAKKCCKSQKDAVSKKCENCRCGLTENPEPPDHREHIAPQQSLADVKSIFLTAIIAGNYTLPEIFCFETISYYNGPPPGVVGCSYSPCGLRAPPVLG